MKKEVKIFLFLLAISLILLDTSFISADSSSVNNEIQKITHYAEEYEIGNINYIQLMVYLSSVKQNLNEILGAVERQEGGLLKQEQVRNALGEPNEETKWVWVERENHEMKLEKYVPIWKKNIFDGKKIRITLSAHPSVFKKKTEENLLIYRLNFETEFKKPEEQLDINSKINEIKTLAEKFNFEPSNENAEILAKESVNAEKIFNEYFRRNQGKCEDVMKGVFGAENQRKMQKMIVNEMEFYEGENFVAKMRLEMCDDCEWHWINVNMWFEGRGPGFKMPEDIGKMDEFGSRERFKSMTSEEFKSETRKLIDEIKKSLETRNYQTALLSSNRLQILNEAWNEKANNVWEEVNKNYVSKQQTLQGKELEEFHRNYGWIKEEQEKRKIVNELADKNYQERKQFYTELFSSYDKKEFYFEQIEFEKRLIENFKEFGKEICNNNIDDNKNEKVDCNEEQCGGKICGENEVDIIIGNETIKEKRKLYCISGTCQVKEEIIKYIESICGNHICEENETIEICSEDCSICQEHPPIECLGEVIFSGKDERGCPLKPVCLNETKTCEKNEDCQQPLCGVAECIKNLCQTTTLTECKERECIDGNEKVINCKSGERLVTSICERGTWKELPVIMIVCEPVEQPPTEEPEEPIVGDECIVKEDCGNENDVCSNGKCVTLPQREESIEPTEPSEIIIEFEGEQRPEEEIEEQKEINEQTRPEAAPESSASETETTEETPITGEIIFNFFRNIAGKITGFAVDGEEVPPQEPTPIEPPTEPPQEPPSQECPDAGPPPPQVNENCWYETQHDEKGCVSGYDVKCGEQKEESVRDDWGKKDFEEERERDEQQRREQECSERCPRECYDKLVSPCVGKCIHESKCMDEGNCDSKIKECEEKCKAEKDIDSCAKECEEKCLKGENTWEEPEQEEHKEEKGVFVAGGGCRISPQLQKGTEGFIWLSGWGEPFDKIQPLKNKYYQGGDADWCKWELENLKKERKEIENGFNQEFAKWFFEEYMANSAEDWEQQMSGIFEMYWRVIDNQMRAIGSMRCLDIKEPSDYKLINFSYETEYGNVEYWEELKEINPEQFIGKGPNSEGIEEGKIKIISPYMKIWVFPPKEFIEYEMKKAMKNHEFPGSPEERMERENEDGPTAEEKAMIKQDKKFMEKLKSITEKYNGNVDVAVQFKDYETNNIVFNLHAQVNEDDIIKMKPMLPEEIPEKDITITIDFEKIYELILIEEKEMRGTHTEMPPWDKEGFKPVGKVKEIKDGIKMYLKVRSIMNSAEITPEDSKGDAEDLFKSFFKMMMKGGPGEREEPQNKEEMKEGENFEGGESPWEDKEVITGEAISERSY